jgi:von Willebrand factor type A domain-containing protein
MTRAKSRFSLISTTLSTLAAIAAMAAMAGVQFMGSAVYAKPKTITVTVEAAQDEPEPVVTKPPFQGQRPSVDVALLLDTSNSMDGLINQAKSQLWNIVQRFATAKKQGQTPLLRVALFEYGNTKLPAAEGYIRQVVPLADNLDKLSEALFGLRTSGGDEYCGQVIDEAITRLDWSTESGGYKAIFIAGNEPFTQGEVDFRSACRRAIEKGVIVNTIHCGSYQNGVDGKWQEGAKLAEGEAFNIDQDRVEVRIDCPQDKLIIKLSAELNKTYLWFGRREEREALGSNQVAQDSNAYGFSAQSAVKRSVAKAGAVYRNAGRDLVDSWEEDAQVLERVKEIQLPEAMQKMTKEERVAHIGAMQLKRKEIQKQIARLNREREDYLADQRKQQVGDQAAPTLGDAVLTTLGKQLKAVGFDQSEQ